MSTLLKDICGVPMRNEAIKAHDHRKFCYRIYVQLASNEWGNFLMERVAKELLAEHRDKPHLVVIVSEHGGWSLSFAQDQRGNVIIVDTANDAAVPSVERRQFWQRVRGLPEVHLGCITREVTRPDVKEVTA